VGASQSLEGVVNHAEVGREGKLGRLYSVREMTLVEREPDSGRRGVERDRVETGRVVGIDPLADV
jgi:hypothetical protein